MFCSVCLFFCRISKQIVDDFHEIWGIGMDIRPEKS